MITNLRIAGFKSFGFPAQSVSLGPLTFVVGANASGKTNLISALRFLQYAVTQNVEYAVNKFNGVAEVRNKIVRQRKDLKPVQISLKFDFPEPIISRPLDAVMSVLDLSYGIELDLRSEASPQIESERLTGKLRDREGKESDYHLKQNRHEVEIFDPTIPQFDCFPQKFEMPPEGSRRLALSWFFHSPLASSLRHEIENWRFYNISPHVARLPFRETSDVDLGPEGENLAVVLHKLEKSNGRNALDSVVSGLKGAIPGFLDIKTTQLPVEGKWAFQIVEEKIKGAINPDSISDGTIRLLALMVIASWSVNNSSLIVIEEPENGLHPHLSEQVVEILRTASERCQIIVTTHNPTFLDYLEPVEVILCDKKDGFTYVRRASDIEDIKTFQKHFRLGELWEQGVLGGIP